MIDRVMIVVAGGSSLRFGGDKLMSAVAGLPLVAHTVEAVRDHVDRCILVCRADQLPSLAALGLDVDLVPGGDSRTASEMAGLAAIGGPVRLIGVHDGARPLVSGDLVETVFAAAAEFGGAIPVLDPPGPLLHRSDLTLASGVKFAQTPQAFHGEALLTAYLHAGRIEYEGHDTAEIVQRFGDVTIKAVAGDPANIKVTHRGDLERVRAVLETSRT